MLWKTVNGASDDCNIFCSRYDTDDAAGSIIPRKAEFVNVDICYLSASGPTHALECGRSKVYCPNTFEKSSMRRHCTGSVLEAF
jgi:hypothetical protein